MTGPGLDLAFDAAGDGPPVIVLHGLFGTARNWAGIARHLARRHRVYVLDARNHGRSPRAATMDYEAMAEDVSRLIDREGLAPAALIGHSMGGKTAMTLALTEPRLVERLTVVDIAPVAYKTRHRELVAQLRGLGLSDVTRRSQVEARLKSLIDDARLIGFLAMCVEIGPDGGQWRFALDVIEAELERLSDFPATRPGTAYHGPTLFIAGGQSDYISPDHGEPIGWLFPQSRIHVIAEAGHWLHVQSREQFLSALDDFLDTP